ncbi:nucleoporin NUP42 [Triplophysa rosa]|uniref:Nucleoporin NUP42 n=1 Tax=Triplophysa rosa TaxID=992332 RepID=A0A9W7TM22_TRIRA|nr:nucleoporin NUP42 [Triplophysa rosa]KAI7798517.1 nucleoporin-like protein 2 [Triplophysa rosa]
MTVCSFYLQGRCRYGDKCWNEHPRGGRGGDYGANHQQPSRGGFGNRVWVNPSQRSGGGYIQPSTFSRDGSDWSKGDVKSSDFSFSHQNRFSALNPQNNNDKGGQTPADDNHNHVDTIQKDMEVWQSSGQWPFSCYSLLSVQISGFVELSPEELRLEYYTGRASGDLQPYVNSVQQLSNQWSSRVQELQTMNGSTQISVISELNNSSPQTSSHGLGSSSGSTSASGFGSTSASGFGSAGFGSSSQSSNTFSFASSKAGFGASDTQQALGFSSTSAAQPPSGFSTAPPSAATFSFAAPAAENTPNTGAFASAAGFSFKSSSSSSSAIRFGSSAAAAAGSAVSGSGDVGDRLFTAHSDLTAEELEQFRAKHFTLGHIPLKPPPADLLMV